MSERECGCVGESVGVVVREIVYVREKAYLRE